MPRAKTLTLTMVASNDDAICAAQTPGGAGALTLDGVLVAAGVATLDVPRHLLLTTSADESAKTVAITGTDRYGNALTTSTTLPNNTTKIVTGYNFKTVTGITIDGATAAAIKVGTANSLDSPWVPLDWRATDAATITVHLSTGANLTYNAKSTVSDIQASGFVESDAVTQDITLLAGTTDVQVLLNGPLRALRFGITSYVTGSATVTILERGTSR